MLADSPEASMHNARLVDAINRALAFEGTGSLPRDSWRFAALRNVSWMPVSPPRSEEDSGTSATVASGTKVREFLNRVYDFSDKGEIDDGIDLIIEQFDEWLRAGRLDMCEGALAQAQVGRMQEDLTFSFLTATLCVKDSLPKYRPRYFAEAKKRIAQLRSADFADSLLARYE